MKVKIIKNLGNSFYDRYIGQEFEAVRYKDIFKIEAIKTMTSLKKEKYIDKKSIPSIYGATYWADNEVEILGAGE